MKVIWKRPDGFHNASPEDYKVVTLDSGASIWLHKTNTEWYPFRLSGDWAKEEGTNKLNTMINMLGEESPDWTSHLMDLYFESQSDDPSVFVTDLYKWIDKVKNHLKGDTWELDIMEQVVSSIHGKIQSAEEKFLAQAKVK